MNLYAYCLSSNVPPEKVADLRGIQGTVPRVLAGDGMAAVVSDIEDREVTLARENVVAHERVIDSVLQWTTPLPFRFGVVVSPERLLDYLGREREVLLQALTRVDGCVEMNVKIAGAGERGAGDLADTKPGVGPGMAFLMAKQRESQEWKIAEELHQAVAGLIREKRIGDPKRGFRIVSNAFLVERSRLAAYQDRLNEFKKRWPAARFLTSGPWPPYSFTPVASGNRAWEANS